MNLQDRLLLSAIANVKNELDKYVYLREDEQGLFIEYVLIDGVPDNNRQLSEYTRNRKIGEIYKLGGLESISSTETINYILLKFRPDFENYSLSFNQIKEVIKKNPNKFLL
jgi:hypothetical protein